MQDIVLSHTLCGPAALLSFESSAGPPALQPVAQPTNSQSNHVEWSSTEEAIYF